MNPLIKLKYLKLIKPYRKIYTTFVINHGCIYATTATKTYMIFKQTGADPNDYRWFDTQAKALWIQIGSIENTTTEDSKNSLIYNTPKSSE